MGKKCLLELDVTRLILSDDDDDEGGLKWKKVGALVEGWDEDRVKRGYQTHLYCVSCICRSVPALLASE